MSTSCPTTSMNIYLKECYSAYHLTFLAADILISIKQLFIVHYVIINLITWLVYENVIGSMSHDSLRATFLKNNFNQMLFCHFVQKVNEIWYPGRAVIIKLLRYQIPLTSCTKWWNDEWLKVSVWSKLFKRKCPFLKMRSHLFHVSLTSEFFGTW